PRARASAERTRCRVLDAVLITASTSDGAPLATAAGNARGRGRIVAVGDTQLRLDRRVFYEKELRLVVSRSYGPGRYDRDYEERGIDYPYEYVRWTLQRNMEAFLDLIPQLQTEPLVSHRFAIDDASQAYALLLGERQEPHLGILLVYPGSDHVGASPARLELKRPPAREAGAEVGVSLVGAGNYARATLLPALEKLEHA